MAEVTLSGGGGKDATVALDPLRDRDSELVERLTTVDAERDRSTVQGVRRELLARQAHAIG